MNPTLQKILIVDDEPDIIELLAYNLTKVGYQIFTAQNGHEAIKEAKRITPDLIIMDIMMPKMDGLEACRMLRSMPEFKKTLLVFLTARSEEYSEIAAFNVGADDYITKPIKPRALVSRIHALLRRTILPETLTELKLQFGDLIIDRETFLVFHQHEKLILTKKEFELLYFLALKPGKVYTREVIITTIWGDATVVTHRIVDVHIRKLREKIGENYIKTLKGVGYKFDGNELIN